MVELLLARWQFGVTSTYHFLFVPLTLGLSILVAIMETLYVRTGNEMYKQMAKFWGKLFLLNFALGVVTGLVQEFQFGMNWSEYSRFMGDIFGAPLALEALTAFYLESTFIGLWVFGWERIPKVWHAACIWIVAAASNLSAFWILVANSFMQSPVGYTLNGGRAEMIDFGALITNPYVWNQFPHTLLAGLTTAGVFVAAISAYHLRRNSSIGFFRASMKIGLWCVLLASLLVAVTGHRQAQFMAQAQPMKLAAMEALWETANPAPLAVYASIDEAQQTNRIEIGVPAALSLMVYNRPDGTIKGLKDLQAEYEHKYGAGAYIPAVTAVFWSFRLMVGSGLWILFIAVLGMYYLYRDVIERRRTFLLLALWTLPLPYIANSTGWFVAEAGRQPWIVFGLQRVEQAVSPLVPASSVWTSLLGFTLVYGLLAAIGLYLMVKAAKQGPVDHKDYEEIPNAKGVSVWN